ncbi:MAG: helix-hairpin-helix domain-containing protein [Bacteroidaceae bacterium]|nr:helix-hairpin-helix domain-containing protein [Bacteroidaceae bacterium]
MRTIQFYLVALCLFLPTMLMAQEINLLLEEQLEEMSANDETLNWNDLLEELSQPIDLNSASKEQLERLPFLSDEQIENILAYIYIHGQMQTVYELQLVENMDRRTIQLLLPFVQVNATRQEKQFPKVKNIAKKGQHEILSRLDIPFYRRKGYEGKYLGTPQYHSLRYQFGYGDYIQAGITAEKDAGEPLFKQHNKQGYDHYGFFLLLRNLGRVKALALGDYKLSFGQGLTMAGGLRLGKGYSLVTTGTRATAIKKHASTDENSYFRGVATTIHLLNELDLSVFYSYRKMDGNIKNDAITSITTTGLHRTQTEADRRGAFSMQVAGGHLFWHKNRFDVGITGLWYGFSKEYMPRLTGYAQYHLNGQHFYNLGMDYQLRIRRLNIAGEVAKGKQGWAMLNRLVYQPSQQYKLMLLHRYYSYDYWAYFANAFNDGGSVQNENGWYMAVEASPISHFRFFGSVDLVSFPWLKYRISKPSKGFEGRLRVEYLPTTKLTMFVNYRYKQKERDVTGTRGELILPTHHHQVRYRLSYQTDKWLLRTTADFNIFSQQNTSYGWQFTQLAGYQLWKLKLHLQGTYFHTDDYDTRVYGYEKGLLYTFYSPSFSGKGIRYSVHFRFDIGKTLMLIAKFGQTHYFDRTVISSGNDQIAGSNKTDLQLQARLKF